MSSDDVMFTDANECLDELFNEREKHISENEYKECENENKSEHKDNTECKEKSENKSNKDLENNQNEPKDETDNSEDEINDNVEDDEDKVNASNDTCSKEKENNDQTGEDDSLNEKTEKQRVETDKCENNTIETEDMFNHLIKLQAEFDNYRKRTENDVSKSYKNGFTDAIVEFLPALDSFKMAQDMITDKNTLMGIKYIEKGILSTLEKMGIKAIDASGEFDPHLHQAIDTDDTAEVESGHIVKECYKGYIMGDKVLRYSQVIVKK